jgi:DNA-entry nuclease
VKNANRALLPFLLAVCILLSACSSTAGTSANTSSNDQSSTISSQVSSESASTPEAAESGTGSSTGATENVNSTFSSPFSLASVPAYSKSPYVEVNGNQPYFTSSELTTKAFETYSDLDSLGRCGVAYANICKELMPTEERGSIGAVKPSGWQIAKYDFVDGKYLYNRCHLIGFQLAGENANEKNLITGTRYMNVDGMLPFENMVADYVKETGNHVLYRVTPIFEGKNLVASGVLMEAESVEDKGEGILFCVYCYNVEPGVTIDYATGNNQLSADTTQVASGSTSTATSTQQSAEQTYILNTNTHKFHYPSCSSVQDMSESNKQTFTGTRDELIAEGYSPCGRCKP